MSAQNPYQFIIVESFVPSNTSGRHGSVHIRPIEGQPYPTSLFVECPKDLVTKYPVGTQFKIRVKLTDREGTPYLYSYFGWKYEVLLQPKI